MHSSHPPTNPPSALTRRKVLAGVALGLVMGRPALAAEADVALAILADYGLLDVPLGEVGIDMPDYSDSGKSVPMTISVPCTMQGLDYPESVSVYAARNPRPRIVRALFTPLCAQATFSTRVRLNSYQDVTVVVKMASGEVFKGVRKVDVTFGACEEAVASDQFPPGWAPRLRVAVPQSVALGEAAEIRTIISHPMENGLRHNAQGLIVPVRIAEWFRCYANEVLVFSAKLEPAIAANPYIAFFVRVDGATALRFEWVDTTGEIYSEQATIAPT